MSWDIDRGEFDEWLAEGPEGHERIWTAYLALAQERDRWQSAANLAVEVEVETPALDPAKIQELLDALPKPKV